MTSFTAENNFGVGTHEPSEESKKAARRAGDVLTENAPLVFCENTFSPFVIEEGDQQVYIKPLGEHASINYYPDEQHPVAYIIELESGTVAPEPCTITLCRNKRRPLIELFNQTDGFMSSYEELISYQDPEKARAILEATIKLITTTLELERATPKPPSLELLNGYAHQRRKSFDEKVERYILRCATNTPTSQEP